MPKIPAEYMEVPSHALHRMRKLTLFPTVKKGPFQVSDNEATVVRAGRVIGVSQSVNSPGAGSSNARSTFLAKVRQSNRRVF
jgi:hypothetical protein